MSEIVMLSTVAGVLGLLTWFMFSTISGIRHELLSNLAEINTPGFQISDDFKQELYDLMHMALEDTVGTMNIPTARDHLVGGIMSLIQSRLGGLDPRSVLNDAIASAGYGEEEIETEKESQ